VPHAYKENDLGTDGCAVCGKARVWRNHTAVANDR
jgi:hypothetical protein